MWLKLTRRYDTSDPEVWTIVFIKNLSLDFTVEVWFEGDKESMHCQEMVTGSSKTNSFLLLLLFSRSVVSDSTTPWTAACQASLSITISQSLLKLTSIVLVMPSNHLVLCYLLLLLPSIFTSTRVFSNELALCIRWSRSIGDSASELVLPVNIQGWFPLGLTGLISLKSKGLSRVFSSTDQKHEFFRAQPSLWSNPHIHTWLQEKP